MRASGGRAAGSAGAPPSWGAHSGMGICTTSSSFDAGVVSRRLPVKFAHASSGTPPPSGMATSIRAFSHPFQWGSSVENSRGPYSLASSIG